MARLDFKRLSLTAATAAVVGALAACGPGQASSSTTVVLTGPPDTVDALIAQHKLLDSPVQAQIDKLDDGRERARFHRSKGLPMGEIVALGKEAARDGVSFEFFSGTKWGAGDPDQVGTNEREFSSHFGGALSFGVPQDSSQRFIAS